MITPDEWAILNANKVSEENRPEIQQKMNVTSGNFFKQKQMGELNKKNEEIKIIDSK